MSVASAKGNVHLGQHTAIVDEALWQAVQDQLANNNRAAKTRTRAKSPSALAGRLVGPDGQKMRPSHATKNGRRYRYYISAGLGEGSIATGARGWRIPATEIEAAIASAIAAKVRDPAFRSELLRTDQAAQADPRRLADAAPTVARQLDDPTGQRARLMLAAIVERASVSETEVQAEVRFAGPGEVGSMVVDDVGLLTDIGFTVIAPIRMARRGAELRLVLQGAAASARHPIRISFVKSSPRAFAWPTPLRPVARSASATSPHATASTLAMHRARCSSRSWRRTLSNAFSTVISPSDSALGA
jgi:hypothetical protein